MFRLLDYKSQVPTSFRIARYAKAYTPTIETMEQMVDDPIGIRDGRHEYKYRIEQLRHIWIGNHNVGQLTREILPRALEALRRREPNFDLLKNDSIMGLVAFECLARIGDAVTGNRFRYLHGRIMRFHGKLNRPDFAM